MSTVYPTSLKRKLPYITVSAKGLSNGLSSIPNDGADFGPDTLLNAKAPNQYGPPYTQTSGIQEAYNYALSKAIYGIGTGGLGYTYTIPPIKLLSGIFNLTEPVYLGIGNYPSSAGYALVIYGNAENNTVINYTGGSATSAITIDPNINNIEIDNLNINNLSTGTLQHLLYWDSAKGAADNIFISSNLVIGGNNTSSHAIHLNNVYLAQIVGLVSPMSPNLYIHGTGFNSGYFYIQGQIWSGGNLDIGNVYYALLSGISKFVYVTNAQTSTYSVTNIKIISSNTSLIINSPVYTIYINSSILNGSSSAGAIQVNANVGLIQLEGDSISGPLLSSTASGTVTIQSLIINGLINIYQVMAFNLSTNISISNYDIRNVPSGTFSTPLPPYSSTSGTTAGTVDMQGIIINPQYKKYVISFSGYENDTTTNQTINFPTAFSSYAVITANNTGLTISASTTGITITSPNSTTTYSGIVIVEGY
jgi:hypothetical protein